VRSVRARTTAGRRRRGGAPALAQERQELVGEHAAHLARHAGEHRDPAAAAVLEPHAGGRAVAVDEGARALGEHRLLSVRRRHRAADARQPPLLERGEVLLVHAHAAPEQFGDGGLRQVVGGRPEAAGGDHRAGAVEGVAHGRGDLVGAVAHRRATDDAHAQGRELAREVRAVGVDGVARAAARRRSCRSRCACAC
jgi:hypothetical protein